MPGPDDNKPTIPETGTPAPETGGGFIDPISISLSGITENEAKIAGYTVVPMTIEDSYEVNKGALKGMTMDMFVDFHKQIYGEKIYDAVKQGDHEMESNPDWDWLKSKDIDHLKPGYAINAHPSTYGLTPSESSGWQIPDNTKHQGNLGSRYTDKGQRTATLHNEELAESRKMYYKPLEDTYGSMEDYELANVNGMPFRTDENGNEHMLVMDHGSKQWVEVPAADVVVGKQLRSMYGPQKRESGVWEHAYDMSQNTMMDIMYSQWGTVSEMAGSFGQFITGGKEMNSWQKFGRELQNYGNASKSKVSEVAENEGLFTNVRGFVGTSAGILTQVGAQALIGLATRGIGSSLSTAGYLGKAASRVINGAPHIFGGIFAANAMNDEAKSAGLNDTDRQLLSLAAFAIVMASEYSTSKILGADGIADGFKSKGSQQAIEASLKKKYSETLSKSAGVLLDKTASESTKVAARKGIISSLSSGITSATGKAASGAGSAMGILQKTMSAPIRFGQSAAPTSMMGRVRGAVAAGWEEGWEEVVEGQLNTFMKNAYNNGWVGYYGPEDNAIAGKGKFQNTKFEFNLEEFVGGMIGGGVMGGMMGGRLKRNFSDNAVAEMAMQYNTFEESDKALAQMHAKGAFGNSFLTNNDQFLSSLPEGERSKAKSRNDIGFESMREELRMAYQLKKALNLNSAEQINKVMGGDMALVRNTLTNALAAKKIEKQLAQDTTAYESLSDKNSSEAKVLYKQIENNKDDLERANTMVSKALDGSMIEEYRSHMLTRAMLVNKNFGTLINDVISEPDGNVRKSKMNSLVDDSIALSETRDLWNDSNKAMTLTNQARDYAKKFDEIQKIIEKRKAESKVSGDLFNETFSNVNIEDEAELESVINNMDEGHYDGDYSKALNSLSARMDEKKKELKEKVDSSIFKAVGEEDSSTIEDVGADSFYDENNDAYSTPLSSDLDKDKEIKRSIKKAAKESSDDIKLIRSLEAKTKEILGKRGRMKKGDDKNTIIYKGDKDASDGGLTMLDSIVDNEIEREPIYVVTDSDGNISESTKEAYDLAKNDSAATESSFNHKGNSYEIREGNYTSITGNVHNEGAWVSKEFKAEFSVVSDAMTMLLREGEQFDGKEIREVMISLLNDFYNSGNVVTKDMRAKMSEIKKILNSKDELFEVLSYMRSLDAEGILTEPQRAYMGLSSYKAMGNGLDALHKKHDIDKSIYDSVNTSLMSKDEREDNMNKLKESTLRMFGSVSNSLLNFIQAGTFEVDGVTLEMPNVLTSNASEVDVMKAMQFWHHYMNKISKVSNGTESFLKQFRLFWHTHVQRKLNDREELLNETRDSYDHRDAGQQGMFLESFESMLNEEAFESGEYTEPNNTYRELFMYHTMNMMMQMDPTVYYGSLLLLLDKVADPDTFDLTSSTVAYKGDHTSEQLLNVMIGMAHIEEGLTRNDSKSDPNKIYFMDSVKMTMKLGTSAEAYSESLSLYSPLSEDGNLRYDTKDPAKSASHIKDNFMLITGSGGVGKTTFFIRTMIEHAVIRGQTKFVLVAPNKQQLEAMKSAIPIGLKKDMFVILSIEEFINQQDKFKDHVIFIDEISLLTQKERNTLYFNGELASINGVEIEVINDNPIDKSNTVFILGDEAQAPYSVEEFKKSPQMSLYMQHGFNMTAVKRTSLVDIFKIQNLFRNQALRRNAVIPTLIGLSYSDESGVRNGVKLNNDKDSFLSEAKTAVLENKGYIIVYDLESFNDIVSEMSAESQKRVFYMTDKNKSPQGQTLNGEVYVYMPQESTIEKIGGSKSMYNKYMLTAVSRATTYVSAYISPTTQNSALVSQSALVKFEDNAKEVSTRKKALYDSTADTFGKLPKIGAKVTALEKTIVPPVTPPVVPPVVPPVTGSEVSPVTTPVVSTVTPPVTTPVNTYKTLQQQGDESRALLTTYVKGKTFNYKGVSYTVISPTPQKTDYNLIILALSNDDDGDRYTFDIIYRVDGEEFVLLDKRPDTFRKTKAEEQAATEVEESVNSTSAAEEEAPTYGTTNQSMTWGIISSEGLTTEYSVIVTKDDIIIKVGATYVTIDKDGVQQETTVTSIKKNEEGKFMISTGRDSEALPEKTFKKRYTAIAKTDISPNHKAIDVLVATMKATFFGKMMSQGKFDSTEPKKNKPKYDEIVKGIITAYNGIGALSSATITVRKNAFVVDYNGKVSTDLKPFVIDINIDGNYFGSHYISSKDHKLLSFKEKAYNDMLYDYLNSVVGENPEEVNLFDGVISIDKSDIVSSSFFDVAQSGSTPMSFASLKDMVNEYGLFISSMQQEQSKTATGISQEGVDTVVYVSSEENPSAKNGKRIILESIPLIEMSAQQKNEFSNYVDNLIQRISSLDLTNEQGINQYLTLTDLLIKYNRANIKSSSHSTAVEGVTAPAKAKARVAFIAALKKQLDNSDIIGGVIGKIRMPLKLVNESGIELTEGNDSFARTKVEVFPRVPVLKVSFHAMFGLQGLAAKVEASDSLSDYNLAWSEAQSILKDLLGFEMNLGMIQSDKLHGFVDKFGKILMNYRDGMTNSKKLYHEIAHYVAEFLLTDSARDILYTEVAKKSGIKNWEKDPKARRDVAEALAEGAERYTSDRRNMKGVSKYLQQFYDWFSSILSKLGIIKRTINDFYYNVYVAKEFKSSDGKMLPMVRTEMPFDSLFARVESKSFNEISNEYFYDKEIANNVARTVGSIIATETILPSQNTRLYQDAETSFTDMVNRVEYFMRSRVMFKTKGEYGEYEYADVVFDGVTMSLPVLRNLPSEGKQMFKWAFNSRDGSGKTIGGLALQYYDTETKVYRSVVANAKGVYFLDKTDRQRIRKSMRIALLNYTVETTEGEATLLGLHKENITRLKTILKKEDKELYKYAMTLYDDVLIATISRFFPTLDIRDMLNKNGKVSFSDIADALVRVQDANIRKESSEVNHMDRQSDIMKLILSTTPRYFVLPNGMEVQGRGTIDYVVANKLMTDLSMNLYNKSGGSSIDQFRNKLRIKIEAYKNIKSGNINSVSDSMNNDSDYISLLSIYNTFFNNQGYVPGMIGYQASHQRILYWHTILSGLNSFSPEYTAKIEMFYKDYMESFATQKKLGQMAQDDTVMSKADFAISLINRAKNSERVLNSIVTHFGSIGTNKFTTIKHFGSGATSSFYSYAVQTGSTEEQALRLEKEILLNMYSDDNTIADRYKDMFMKGLSPINSKSEKPNPANFYVTDIGIMYYKSGKSDPTDNGVVIIPIDKNISGKYAFAGLTSVGINAIRTYATSQNTTIFNIIKKVFTDFLNKSDVDSSVVKMLSTNAVGTDRYGIENLHTLFGPMIGSMYTHTIERTILDTTEYPMHAIYNEALESFTSAAGMGVNYGKTTDSQRAAMIAPEAGEVITAEGNNYFFPTAFYKEIQNLASMFALRDYNPTIPDVTGRRKIYVTGVQSNMGYKLSDGNNLELVKLYSNTVKEGHTNFNSRGTMVLNPLLGKKNFISETKIMLGVKGTSTAADLKNMTKQDNYHAAMADFTKFINRPYNSFALTSLPVPFMNQGHRGQQMSAFLNFNIIEGQSNGLIIKSGDNSFTPDYHNIIEHARRAFAMKEEAQVNSLNRWVRYLSNPAYKEYTGTASNQFNDSFIIDTTQVDWKVKRDITLSALTGFIRGFGTTIIDTDIPAFDGSGLTLGIDYIIIKKSKDDSGGRLYLGYDTNMMEDVYTSDAIAGGNRRTTSEKSFNKYKYNKLWEITLDDGTVVSLPTHKILATDDMSKLMSVTVMNKKGESQVVYYNEEMAKEIAQFIFYDHHEENDRVAKEAKYVMSDDLPGVPLDWKFTGTKVSGKINGIWEAFGVAHAMLNFYFDHGLEGTQSMHLSPVLYESDKGNITYGQNRNKRSLSHSSTGMAPSAGTFFGIDAVTRTLTIRDLKMNAAINSITGTLEKEHTVFDGQSFNNPFYLLMYYEGMGATNGSQNISGGMKTIGMVSDFKSAKMTMKKHAADTFSKTMLESSSDAARLFEIMLNPQAKRVIRNAAASLLYKGDIDAMPNDNLYQRYLIYLDNTGTKVAVDNTIVNISKVYGSVKEMIEKVINAQELKPSVIAEWNMLQKDGLALGKYVFLQKLLNESSNQDMLAEEGEKNHNDALKELHHFYVDARAKGKNEKYKYISAIMFSQDKKEQARGFEMPYVPYNKGMGATHKDANGEFTQGRDMLMFSPLGSTTKPTSLYELYDQWVSTDEDAPFEMWTDTFDNTQEITQLNPNREIDDNEESPMVQAMSIILANPKALVNGLARKMTKQISDLMRTGMENMMRHITNEGEWEEGIEDKIESLKINTESGLSIAEKQVIEKYVKSKIKKSMSSTDDSTLLSTIINDDDISINVSPGAVVRVIQYLSAFIKKEAIKRKVEAMRLVQFGGNLIDLMDHKQSGEVFMRSEAIKHAAKMGVPVEELFDAAATRTLKYSTVELIKDKTQSIEQQSMLESIDISEQQAISLAQTAKEVNAIIAMHSKIRMKYLIEQGLAAISKGEAVVPAVKFKKYNIPSTVGLNELYRLYYNEDGVVKELNLREVSKDYKTLRESIASFVTDNLTANVRFTKNSGKPRISFGYSDSVMPGMNKYFDLLFLDGANGYMSEQHVGMSKILKEVEAAMREEHGDLYDSFVNDTMEEKAFDEMQSQANSLLTERVVKYADDFINKQVDMMTKGLRAVLLSLDSNIGMRTPSGPGSGFVNDIVGFVNDNGAIGYINTIKNLIDGSDQDVDQFTLYFTSDTLVDMGVMSDTEYAAWKKEKIQSGQYDTVTDEEGNRINNNLIGLIKEYYLDAEYSGFTMSAIDLDPVKKAANGTYDKLFPSGDVAYNFGQSISYREIAMDGQAVGPIALQQKLQTLLYSGFHSNSRKGISRSIYPFNIGDESVGDTTNLYADVPPKMEMMTNAATDNPKLLALGAMNIAMSNSDMASAIIFASEEIIAFMRKTTPSISDTDAILEFLKGDANASVFKFVKNESNMINGGFSPTYFSSAHSYYNSLSKNYDNNKLLLDKTSADLISSQEQIRFLLKEVAEISDEEINMILAQNTANTGFDGLLTYLSKKTLKGLNNKVKSKHAKLKKFLNAELESRISGQTDEAIISSIKDAILSPMLNEAYGLLDELSDSEINAMTTNAFEESKQVSKKWSDLLKEIRRYKELSKTYKYNSKITDSEGYMKEAYLVAKYAMLGEVMRNLTKIANINQFQIGSSYEINSFSQQVQFTTGYTIDRLISIYDEFKAWKESTNNVDATISSFFDEFPNMRSSVDAIRKAAIDTKRHTMAQKNYKWMVEPITSPDGTETLNYLEDFHTIFDFAEIILSRPDIIESIRAVQLMRDTSDSMFSVRHPDMVRMQREIEDEAGFDSWSEEKHNTYYEEINRYYMHLFLNSGASKYEDEFSMYQDYFDALSFYGVDQMPLYSKGNAGMIPSTFNPIGIRTFITTFPSFFKDTAMPSILNQLRNIDPSLENSSEALEFLNRLEVTAYNNVDFLDVKRSRIQTADEIQTLRAGFNALPKEARTMLAFYQMMKDGFEYNKSFFGQVMPKEYLKRYTEFLTNDLPNMNMKDHIENLKIQILSNTSLNLLRKETFLKKGDKFVSVPPSSANGLVRFYYKTVQTQKRKGYSAIRTMALAETIGIKGTPLVKGPATRETDKIVPFEAIIDLDKDFPNNEYEVTLADKSYNVKLKPIAYIRWFIHGHAELALTKAIQDEIKATGSDVSPQRVNELANEIMNKDFNKGVYKLKGIPVMMNVSESEENKKVIQSKVLDLLKTLMIEKYGDNLDSRIKSLKGKVIKDKYYSGDMSASHLLFSVLNTMGEYNAENFLNATSIKSAEEIEIYADELPPLVSRTGLLSNYFTLEDAVSSGNVVQLHLPDKAGIGRRTGWDLYMQNKFSFYEQDSDIKAKENILASILMNLSLGISGRDAVNIDDYINATRLNDAAIEELINEALKGNYVHRDLNVTKDTSVLHANSLSSIRKLVEAGKLKEAFTQLSVGDNVFTISKYDDIPYKVGDHLYFPDGIVGIVTTKVSDKKIYYVIDSRLSTAEYYQPTQRSLMSVEQILDANNNRTALDGFVSILSKAMPNVEYRYVNDAEAKVVQKSNHPSMSFFQDGIIYINIDKADSGVAIHEFAHPLMLAVQANNPALFAAISKVVSNSPVMDHVRRLYGNELKDENAILMEAIPTFIQLRYYTRLRATQSVEERSVWDSFWQEIKNSFKELATGDINIESSIDNINFGDANLNAIGDAIINDMLKGKPLTNITTYELAQMMPYTMRAATSSKLKNLSLKNIDRLFQKRSDNSDDAKIRRHLRTIVRGTTYSGLSGTYDLSMRNNNFYDSAGNYSAELRKTYVEDIISKELKLYEGIDDRVVSFLYKLNDLKPLNAAVETLFSSWSKRYDLANATEGEKSALESKVLNMINKLGFNPATDVALPLQRAMELLNIKLPTNINGSSVIVIIHDKGKPNQQLSILTALPDSLYNYGVGEHTTLGASFLGEGLTAKERRANRKLEGVKLTNSNSDVETLKNAVIGMAIKNINPSLVIKKIGAINVTGNNIHAQNRDMEDVVPQVEILFNTIPQLSASLERDLYDVVMKKSLYNLDLYKRPLKDKLNDYFRTLLMNQPEGSRYTQSIERTLETVNQIYEGHNFDKYTALQKAVYARIIHLRNDLSTDEMRANNGEYQHLLHMYRELTGYNEVGTNRIDAMTFDEKIIGTADRWSGQIRTWVFDQIDLASRKAVEEMLPFQKDMDSKTKTLNIISGNILSFGADKSHELFKPIFKTTKAIDSSTGALVDVSTHEIHHDANDLETALALKNGTLTKEQLSFGKWLADELYNEFVEYVMVVERGTISKKIGSTKEELRASAIFDVDRRYKRGMMPVFVRSVGAAINEGSYSEALSLYMKSASKWYGGNLYEEYSSDSNIDGLQKDHFKKLLSPFWEQFTASDNGGSDSRMKMMGLDYDRVGNLILEEPMAQQSLSFNLQNIGNYAMLSSKRTKHMQMSVASVNVAMDMLRGEQAEGVNTKDIQEHMENYVNRQVYGNLPELPRIMVNGMSVSLDAAIGGTGKMINMIHLAVNVKLGAKNAVANGSKLIINALINTLAGKNFNIQSVTRAATELFSNPEKIKSLNEKYQLVQVTERDIINHWKYVHTKKNATETDMQMVVHWFGDYYSQLIGAMAQMMTDGTYDAHDSKGNYNPTEDKRFEGEDGEIIKNAIMEQQYKENYHAADNKMTHAYSQRGENAIKVHVQRFVGELNDSKFKNYISSYALAQAVMSLKSYIYNVAQAWWKNPSATVHMGKWGVKEVNGSKEAVWIPEVTEGIIQTLMYCTKGLAKAATGDVTTLKNMTAFQKRNLISMGVYTAVVAGVYLLADAMLTGEDDEDKKPEYEYSIDPKTGKRVRKLVEPQWIGERLMEMMYSTKYVSPTKDSELSYSTQLSKYVLMGAINEQLSFVSPFRPVQDALVRGPYLAQASNLGDLLWATMALPWTLTKEDNVSQATQEYLYTLSKNVQFGSIYRNGKDAFDGFTTIIDNETKTK